MTAASGLFRVAILAFLLLSPAVASADPTLEKLAEAAAQGRPKELQVLLAEQGAERPLVMDDFVFLLRAGVHESAILTLTGGVPIPIQAYDLAKRLGPLSAAELRPDPQEEASPAAFQLLGPYYLDGHPYYVYDDGRIRMQALVLCEGRYTFAYLSVFNGGDEPWTIFPKAARLSVGSTKLLRLEPSAYINQLENRALLNIVLLAALNAAASAAGNTAQVNTTTQGPDGSTWRSTSTVRTGPSGSEIAARDARIRAAADRAAARITTADEALLRANTLMPGDQVAGVVPFEHRGWPGAKFRMILDTPSGAVELVVHARD